MKPYKRYKTVTNRNAAGRGFFVSCTTCTGTAGALLNVSICNGKKYGSFPIIKGMPFDSTDQAMAWAWERGYLQEFFYVGRAFDHPASSKRSILCRSRIEELFGVYACGAHPYHLEQVIRINKPYSDKLAAQVLTWYNNNQKGA